MKRYIVTFPLTWEGWAKNEEDATNAAFEHMMHTDTLDTILATVPDVEEVHGAVFDEDNTPYP
jgi:hypothetical protein